QLHPPQPDPHRHRGPRIRRRPRSVDVGEGHQVVPPADQPRKQDQGNADLRRPERHQAEGARLDGLQRRQGPPERPLARRPAPHTPAATVNDTSPHIRPNVRLSRSVKIVLLAERIVSEAPPKLLADTARRTPEGARMDFLPGEEDELPGEPPRSLDERPPEFEPTDLSVYEPSFPARVAAFLRFAPIDRKSVV